MAFWLDLGCDGFRVDMASSLVKLDTDGRAMRALWSEFRRWLERRNPEAVLIAEWSRPSDAIAAGFHVDFLIHFNEPAYNELIGPTRTLVRGGRTPSVFFQRQGGGDIRPFLDNYLEQYEATKHLGFIALPTGNHDFPRPRHGRSEAELRVLYTMLLLMPGVPFIYYGDEIGMRYLEGLPSKEGSYEKRTGTRTPMQWNRGKNRGFSKAPSGALYLPVDAAADAPTVDAQQRSPTSLLNFTKRLLALRQTSAALQNAGGFRPVVTEPTKPFVFERFSKTERYLVAINPSSRAATTPLPETSHRWVSVVDEGVAVKDGVLRARPVSAGVFRRA
jgi:maltose alpha-D-glucosyltransferase/alpha-amylase